MRRTDFKKSKPHTHETDRRLTANRQQGVSLLEVLIAMFILTFGALAIVNLQTASTIAMSSSADHFKINELSQTMIEQLKADSGRAAIGDYNTDFTEAAGPATASADVNSRIRAWKATMSRSTPLGEASIDCDADECTIGLRWYEISHDGSTHQTFNAKTPL